MTINVSLEPLKGTLAEDLAEARPNDGSAALWWLGQAGFAFRHGDCLGMIDPYLSEHLTKKYERTPKAHQRLMPAPLKTEEARGLNVVLCSHAHSDHMDPDGLKVLAWNNPDCFFVIPEAVLEVGIQRGIPPDRVRGANAGDSIALGDDTTVHVIPAAHEELKTDENGNHYFLGFVLSLGDLVLFHSGDCVPYEGLEDALRPFSIDAALLPVNGRDERRRSMNIVGNFEFEEAAELCLKCGIPILIPHHFGMFAVNTVPVEELKRKIARLPGALRCLLPDVNRRIVLRQG